MKTKREQSQTDLLEELRREWGLRKERAGKLPSLTDEELDRLLADYCVTHGEMPKQSPRGRQTLVWTQVLSAAVCLGAAVWSMVLCGRLGNDRIIRIILYAIALGCLLLAIQSIFPHLSPLFRRYCDECGVSKRPYASFGLHNMVPVGITFVAVLVFAVAAPTGDGYYMTTMGGSRLAHISTIDALVTQIA